MRFVKFLQLLPGILVIAMFLRRFFQRCYLAKRRNPTTPLVSSFFVFCHVNLSQASKHLFSINTTCLKMSLNCCSFDSSTKLSHVMSKIHLHGFGGQAFKSSDAPPVTEFTHFSHFHRQTWIRLPTRMVGAPRLIKQTEKLKTSQVILSFCFLRSCYDSYQVQQIQLSAWLGNNVKI